jgi:alkyldihydroxyacetonephosphate synthase
MMRRWNGWGDTTIVYPMPEGATEFLEQWVGKTSQPKDVSQEKVLAGIPPSKITPHPLISTDANERLFHARGQSMPDWLAMHSGKALLFPDGVAYPATDDEVRSLIRLAAQTGTRLIPYGGGTSVTGHINPLPSDQPLLTVDMRRMSRLNNLDDVSHLATFGAGIAGPDLESQLRAQGFTLGHFPQSFELSTLGGWIATRSCGQQSLGYGRIERLFAGGHLETPAGSIELPSFPASAVGPDLKEIVLGSEGRFGIITEATMRITPLPEKEVFHAVFLPNFECGMAAARQIVQTRLPLSMIRLSTANETKTMMALAGHRKLLGAMEKFLSLRGIGEEKCMLMLGFTGRKDVVHVARSGALTIASSHYGIHVGQMFGKQWHKKRFLTPYLRNTLWEAGYAIDTLETATHWSNVPVMIKAIEESLLETLAKINERIHIFTHLSQLYPSGASIYTSYFFRMATDADETLSRWQALKAAASREIVKNGGTISHQHGVGTDHLPYMAAEKGQLGMAVISSLCKQFDPQGIMNPGKLIL